MEDNETSNETSTESSVDLSKSETQDQTPSKSESKQLAQNEEELDAEKSRSFFHVTTRYKIILIFSLILLLIEGLLIYATVQGALDVPPWQVSVWALAAACSIYSIVRKSILGLILNFILFFGISLLPVYSELGVRFKPVIDLFIGN